MGKKSKLREVPRAAWDFSLCPTAEFSFCTAYEYLRQVAMAHRERFKKIRRDQNGHRMFSRKFLRDISGMENGWNSPALRTVWPTRLKSTWR
jgi:hypothetical protein